MSNNEEKEKIYKRDIFWLIVSGIVVILSIFALIIERKLWLNIISGILLTLAIITFIRKGYMMYKKYNSPEAIRERNFPIISQYPDIERGIGLKKRSEQSNIRSSLDEELLRKVNDLLAYTEQQEAEAKKLVSDTYTLLNKYG